MIEGFKIESTPENCVAYLNAATKKEVFTV